MVKRFDRLHWSFCQLVWGQLPEKSCSVRVPPDGDDDHVGQPRPQVLLGRLDALVATQLGDHLLEGEGAAASAADVIDAAAAAEHAATAVDVIDAAADGLAIAGQRVLVPPGPRHDRA